MYDYIVSSCKRGMWTHALRAVHGGLGSGFTVEPKTLSVVLHALSQHQRWAAATQLYAAARRTVLIDSSTFRDVVLPAYAYHPGGWRAAIDVCCERIALCRRTGGESATDAQNSARALSPVLLLLLQEELRRGTEEQTASKNEERIDSVWRWCLAQLESAVQDSGTTYVTRSLSQGMWQEALDNLVMLNMEGEEATPLVLHALLVGKQWDAAVTWARQHKLHVANKKGASLPANLAGLVLKACAHTTMTCDLLLARRAYSVLMADEGFAGSEEALVDMLTVCERSFACIDAWRASVLGHASESPLPRDILKMHLFSPRVVDSLIRTTEKTRDRTDKKAYQQALESALVLLEEESLAAECASSLPYHRLILFVTVEHSAAVATPGSEERVIELANAYGARTASSAVPHFMQDFYARQCTRSLVVDVARTFEYYDLLPNKTTAIAGALMRHAPTLDALIRLYNDGLKWPEATEQERDDLVHNFTQRGLQLPRVGWSVALLALTTASRSYHPAMLPLIESVRVASPDGCSFPHDAAKALERVEGLPTKVSQLVLRQRWDKMESATELLEWLAQYPPAWTDAIGLLSASRRDHPCLFVLFSYTMKSHQQKIGWSQALKLFTQLLPENYVTDKSAQLTPPQVRSLRHVLATLDNTGNWAAHMRLLAQLRGRASSEDLDSLRVVALKAYGSAPWQAVLALYRAVEEPTLNLFQLVLKALEKGNQYHAVLNLCEKSQYANPTIDGFRVRALRYQMSVVEHQVERLPSWSEAIDVYRNSPAHQRRLLRVLEKRIPTINSVSFARWFIREALDRDLQIAKTTIPTLADVCFRYDGFKDVLQLDELRKQLKHPETPVMRRLVHQSKKAIERVVQEVEIARAELLDSVCRASWQRTLELWQDNPVYVRHNPGTYSIVMPRLVREARATQAVIDDMANTHMDTRPNLDFLAKFAIDNDVMPILINLKKKCPEALSIKNDVHRIVSTAPGRHMYFQNVIAAMWQEHERQQYVLGERSRVEEEMTMGVETNDWCAALQCLRTSSIVSPNTLSLEHTPSATKIAEKLVMLLLSEGRASEAAHVCAATLHEYRMNFATAVLQHPAATPHVIHVIARGALSTTTTTESAESILQHAFLALTSAWQHISNSKYHTSMHVAQNVGGVLELWQRSNLGANDDVLRDYGSELLSGILDLPRSFLHQYPLGVVLDLTCRHANEATLRKLLARVSTDGAWEPHLIERFPEVIERCSDLTETTSMIHLVSLANKFNVSRDSVESTVRQHLNSRASADYDSWRELRDASTTLMGLARTHNAWQFSLWLVDAVFRESRFSCPTRVVPKETVRQCCMTFTNHWTLAARVMVAHLGDDEPIDATCLAIVLTAMSKAAVRPGSIVGRFLDRASLLRQGTVDVFAAAFKMQNSWEAAIKLYLHSRATQSDAILRQVLKSFASDFLAPERSGVTNAEMRVLMNCLAAFDSVRMHVELPQLPSWLQTMVATASKANVAQAHPVQHSSAQYHALAHRELVFLQGCLAQIMHTTSPRNVVPMMELFEHFGVTLTPTHFQYAMKIVPEKAELVARWAFRVGRLSPATWHQAMGIVPNVVERMAPDAAVGTEISKLVASGEWYRSVAILSEQFKAGNAARHLASFTKVMHMLSTKKMWYNASRMYVAVKEAMPNVGVAVQGVHLLIATQAAVGVELPAQRSAMIARRALADHRQLGRRAGLISTATVVAICAIATNEDGELVRQLMQTSAGVPVGVLLPLLHRTAKSIPLDPMRHIAILSNMCDCVGAETVQVLEHTYMDRVKKLPSWAVVMTVYTKLRTAHASPSLTEQTLCHALHSLPLGPSNSDAAAPSWELATRLCHSNITTESLSTRKHDVLTAAVHVQTTRGAPWDVVLGTMSHMSARTLPQWVMTMRRVLEHCPENTAAALSRMMDFKPDPTDTTTLSSARQFEFFKAFTGFEWTLALQLLPWCDHDDNARATGFSAKDAVAAVLVTLPKKGMFLRCLQVADWGHAHCGKSFITPSVVESLTLCIQKAFGASRPELVRHSLNPSDAMWVPLSAVAQSELRYSSQMTQLQGDWVGALALYDSMLLANVKVERTLSFFVSAIANMPQGSRWMAAARLYRRHSEGLRQSGFILKNWFQTIASDSWCLACQVFAAIPSTSTPATTALCLRTLMKAILCQAHPRRAIAYYEHHGAAHVQRSQELRVLAQLATLNDQLRERPLSKPEDVTTLLEGIDGSWYLALGCLREVDDSLIMPEHITAVVRMLPTASDSIAQHWGELTARYPNVALSADCIIGAYRYLANNAQTVPSAMAILNDGLKQRNATTQQVVLRCLEHTLGNPLGWWASLLVCKHIKSAGGVVEPTEAVASLVLEACARSTPVAWAAGLDAARRLKRTVRCPHTKRLVAAMHTHDQEEKAIASAGSPWLRGLATLLRTTNSSVKEDAALVADLRSMPSDVVRMLVARTLAPYVPSGRVPGKILVRDVLGSALEAATAGGSSLWVDALALLNVLPYDVVKMVPVAHRTQLHAHVYKCTADWARGLDVIQRHTHCFDTTTLFRCLRDHHEDGGGDSRDAMDLDVYDSAVDATLDPEMATYRALLLSCVKGQHVQWENALSMFHAMEVEGGIAPNAVMMDTVLRVLQAGKQWELAVRLVCSRAPPDDKKFEVTACGEHCLEQMVPLALRSVLNRKVKIV
eukprot:PhM_4_TR18770/c0_g1_i1/m.58877